MISALYNDAIIAKANRIVQRARELPYTEREEFCQKLCGLSFSYLCRVGTKFKKPSGRVLMNLGFEVYVKDLDTGEFSLLDTDVKCDWNPANPRLNPSSTPIFETEASEASSGSE